MPPSTFFLLSGRALPQTVSARVRRLPAHESTTTRLQRAPRDKTKLVRPFSLNPLGSRLRQQALWCCSSPDQCVLTLGQI